MKRAFHCSIQVGIKLTAKFGLTPARFDLLYALKAQGEFWYPQRDLRKILGIAPSTLSRMIEALVQRGFLARRRVAGDRKRRELAMTRFGRRALRCAFGKIVKSGVAREMVERAIVLDVRGYSPDALHRATFDLDSTLESAGFAWGNRSLLEYPFDDRQGPPANFSELLGEYRDSSPDMTDLLVDNDFTPGVRRVD
jgi:DNA-binding MarR family transcriptional regulator